MKTRKGYHLAIGKASKGVGLPPRLERQVVRILPAKPTISSRVVYRALKAMVGWKDIIKKIPSLDKWQFWLPIATFSVCMKTGTAMWLDIWDADHFDGFTDMQRNLAECRVWFSADGFTYWDSPQTKTGRINCYFKAPSTGNYVCNVQLQSYGGSAIVECLIDSFNYGPLPFNGSINQPHMANLSEGYHHFRIRQKSGSFFFVSLTVWKV